MCKQLVVKDVCNNVFVFVFVTNFVLGNFIYIKKKWKMGKELAVMDSHQCNVYNCVNVRINCRTISELYSTQCPS